MKFIKTIFILSCVMGIIVITPFPIIILLILSKVFIPEKFNSNLQSMENEISLILNEADKNYEFSNNVIQLFELAGTIALTLLFLVVIILIVIVKKKFQKNFAE